jgi:hypothetical protein
LLGLLTATFGFSHITYLNCYSAYIAATIAVLHFQHQEDASALPNLDVPSEKLSLKFFLAVLQETATAMPALGRSVEIIKRHMQAILDKRAKRYLESLFPADPRFPADTEERGSFREGVSNSVCSTMSSQSPNQYRATGPTSEHSIVPSLMQSENSFQYSSFNLEGLPAFPGQIFNVGSNGALDQEITDPELRSTLLGLDPHVTLHHDNSDWGYEGFYMGNET